MTSAAACTNHAGGNANVSTQEVGFHPPRVPPLPPSPTKMNANQNVGIKKLLPVATFFFAFATVMTLLVIYMDNKALRHHQFNVNMTQDYELLEVEQDNTQLINAIAAYFLKPAVEMHHHKVIEFTDEEPERNIAFILKLLKQKKNGSFIEAGAYGDGKTSKTEWLEKKLSWHGLLIQPDPRHYFGLLRHNRVKSQALHGCLSPAPYPKEVTYYQEDRDGVKINSVHSNVIDNADVFNTRLKCFPVYSLMLATNMTKVDYFGLESRGTELQVLQTIPFDRVKIQFIDVHILSGDVERGTINEFLSKQNYTLVQNYNDSQIYRLDK